MLTVAMADLTRKPKGTLFAAEKTLQNLASRKSRCVRLNAWKDAVACDEVWAGEESASSSAIALHYKTSGGSAWPCINLSFPRSKRQCVTHVRSYKQCLIR